MSIVLIFMQYYNTIVHKYFDLLLGDIVINCVIFLHIYNTIDDI